MLSTGSCKDGDYVNGASIIRSKSIYRDPASARNCCCVGANRSPGKKGPARPSTVGKNKNKISTPSAEAVHLFLFLLCFTIFFRFRIIS